MQKYQYNSKLESRSKELRKRLTYGEAKMWKYISKDQLSVRFRRQFPIDKYIRDFYAPSIKLAIEIDGSSHDDKKYDYDVNRQKKLESRGTKFIRFKEFEVMNNLDNVLPSIDNLIQELQLLRPNGHLI